MTNFRNFLAASISMSVLCFAQDEIENLHTSPSTDNALQAISSSYTAPTALTPTLSLGLSPILSPKEPQMSTTPAEEQDFLTQKTDLPTFEEFITTQTVNHLGQWPSQEDLTSQKHRLLELAKTNPDLKKFLPELAKIFPHYETLINEVDEAVCVVEKDIPVISSLAHTAENILTGFGINKIKVKLGMIQKKFLKKEQELINGLNLSLHSVVLFNSSNLIGSIIKNYSHASYSHAGLCLKDPQSGKKFIFESKGSIKEIFHLVKPQVQIDLFENVVPNYNGSVVERTFNFAPGFEPSSQNVMKALNLYLGVPYEEVPVELLKACSRSNTTQSIESMFCSELVAQVLQDLGYLDKHVSSNNYTPRDFSQAQQSLNLLNVTLSDEIPLNKIIKKNVHKELRIEVSPQEVDTKPMEKITKNEIKDVRGILPVRKKSTAGFFTNQSPSTPTLNTNQNTPQPTAILSESTVQATLAAQKTVATPSSSQH